jgi:hypothetical protein
MNRPSIYLPPSSVDGDPLPAFTLSAPSPAVLVAGIKSAVGRTLEAQKAHRDLRRHSECQTDYSFVNTNLRILELEEETRGLRDELSSVESRLGAVMQRDHEQAFRQYQSQVEQGLQQVRQQHEEEKRKDLAIQRAQLVNLHASLAHEEEIRAQVLLNPICLL